jgi:D-glycero-D-manno-heptose 1,7-bisphosphate phosphatase
MLELLAAAGATVDALFACPNHPGGSGTYGGDHDWRKPNPGMVTAAIRALNLAPAESWLVGDKISDIQAAKGAGLERAIHVLTGHGAEERDRVLAEASAGFEVHQRNSLADCAALMGLA